MLLGPVFSELAWEAAGLKFNAFALTWLHAVASTLAIYRQKGSSIGVPL